MTEGRFRRAYVGIAGGARPLPPRLAKRLGRGTAVEIADVVDGSPAAAAGLRGGDLIVAVNGRPIEDVDDMQRLMTGDLVGERVTVEVIRAERTLELALVPAELAV
jgi:S1-C subfamily serine protease